MTAKTRTYKDELDKDYRMMVHHNNSKEANRTAEQNAQHKADKQKFYIDKWNKMLDDADTEAQKRYCLIALATVSRIR